MSALVFLEVSHGPPSAEVLELRRVVLRDGGPVATAWFPGDEDAQTTHVLARGQGAPVGAGTLVSEPLEGEPGWRVRGMAVVCEWRGRGVGSMVLDELLAVLPEDSGLVWCRARVRASSLYARHGFVPMGGVYELAGIGPHVTMVRR